MSIRHPFGVTMYDSVTVLDVPKAATHAAGYVDGRWPTYANGSLRAHLPWARLVSIATSASSKADVLDVEHLDATNEQAVAWVKARHAEGVRRPILYTSVSNWKPLAALLAANGIKHRPYGKSYRRWSAHYTFKPHRCGRSCGMPGFTRAGATQWTDKALGRNLDASLCGRSFFP